MFRFTLHDFLFTGLFVEGFLYGVYSGIFAIYLQYCASKKETNKMNNVIFYSLSTLYVLSIALFVSDLSNSVALNVDKPVNSILRIYFIQTTLFACCDAIAQFILIYRCWIVWGRNIRTVIIPSILSLASLAAWLAGHDSAYIISGQMSGPEWGNPMLFSSLGLSLIVNTLVTGLIVFRIFKVFREVKATSDDLILGAGGGSKLRGVMFILIESGMALFSIQLARLMVSILWTDAATRAYEIIVTIHGVLNGITPTIILVRTSMGLSFHDEKSMEKCAIESLRFASSHPNSVSEMGSIGIVNQDNGDDDDIGVRS